MSSIIFGGVEIPSNRTLLERSGVTNVMLNYWGLRKRGLPTTKPYLIGEHFLPEMKVWVDSGAVQADKANLSREELEDYAADYEEFISLNYDRIEGWVEFDSQVLGFDWVLTNRDAFENDPKMWVVWHEKYGTNVLSKWADTYQHIAIPYETVESVTNLASIIRLNIRRGCVFHLLASAKPDNLRQIPFASTSTLAWLSPMRRGETIVWDGNRLVRYPKSMKEQARKRYKTVVEKAGLDFDKFVSDDTLEATRLAIWSYLQLEANMDKNKPEPTFSHAPKNDQNISDNNDDTLYSGLMELGGVGSNNSDLEMRKPVSQRNPQEVVSMPVFGYEMKTVVETIDGRDVLVDVPVVKSQSGSIRQCNTCYVASNCPAFKPDTTCAFNLPVEVKTKEQLKALLTAVIEMQGQRVAFMRFSEELNGGYADPNTSQEVDRLLKLVKSVKELDEQKEFVQITAQRSSSGGVLSAIFGDRAQALREMSQPLDEQQTTMIIRDSLE